MRLSELIAKSSDRIISSGRSSREAASRRERDGSRAASRGQWDGARIAQALYNLLGNAYQHGSQNVPIEVVLRGEPEQVVLAVHNKGPVIPKGHMQDIFNPFRQLTRSRRSRAGAASGWGSTSCRRS